MTKDNFKEEGFYQETLLKSETTRDILAGHTYKYNDEESIKSLFLDGEEYFTVNEMYEFLNAHAGLRDSYIRSELTESGLSITLSKWELMQGGLNLDVSMKTLTNKRGLVTIISLLDYPDETRIKFVEEEIINTNNKPEEVVTEYVKYMVLPLDVIQLDTNYQRKTSMQKVREIAKKFDIRVVGALIVSKREDGYYLVDGQHRKKSMELKNIRTVMCAVHENLTLAEEADLFLKCNNSRKAPTALDNFSALIMAGDKDAIRIYDLCKEVGYSINLRRNEDNQSGYHMVTVSGLQTAYKTYGEEILEKTLRVLYAAEIQKPSSTEIHGLALYLHRYSDIGFNLSELSERLSKHSQTELLAKARTMTEVMGGHVSTNYARTILGIYNNKKVNRLEDRFSNMK